jgi:hypothetical protein
MKSEPDAAARGFGSVFFVCITAGKKLQLPDKLKLEL